MDLTRIEAEETELNMTPMIDIVFQLIIFFLLSLKFKTLDRRIESMLPKKDGLTPTPQDLTEEDKIKVKLFRRNLSDRNAAYTLLKVDNVAQFKLPEGWKGRAREPSERVRRYDEVMTSVRKRLDAQLRAYGNNPDAVKGEIVAPPPRGGSVPHGDAVAVLNAFLQLGITNVKFEGTPTPLNKTERAARARR